MRVTIVPEDKLVIVNGEARSPLDFIVPSNIHAVQWYGTHGEVEFVGGSIDVPKPQNEAITDLAPFQAALDAWAAWTPPEPPPPPPPPPITMLTRSQFFRMLARSGIVTPEEAVSSSQTGVMPPAIEAIITGLSPLDQADARILFATASVFEKANPLFAASLAAGIVTEAQLDEFFTAGAALP